MEMDRSTLLVLFGVIIALTLTGVFWLNAGPMDRHLNEPVYSQDDIRLKFQQHAHSRKGLKSPAEDPSSSPEPGSGREETAEEPPAEEPDAEEPPIDEDNDN